MSSTRLILIRMLTLVIVAITLTACGTPQFLEEEELKVYVSDNENGTTIQKESKGFQTTVTLRPTDLLILQETQGEVVVDSATYNRLYNKYKNYYYFILGLSKDAKEAEYQTQGGFGQFSDVVQTLSFRMTEYVNMTTKKQDTIPVSDYIYPRTFGMSNASNLMFAFNKEKSVGNDWIQFNLREFGLGTGNQNFRFKVADLERVPKIEFAIKQKETTKI